MRLSYGVNNWRGTALDGRRRFVKARYSMQSVYVACGAFSIVLWVLVAWGWRNSLKS